MEEHKHTTIMASSNQSTEYPTSTTATVTVSSKGMNYYEALAWMAEKDSNTLAIVNFSDEENPYLIEGGPESLLELEWDESDEECVAEYELYKLRDCPSEYWDSEEESDYEEEYIDTMETEDEEEDMSLCVNLSGTKEEAWKVLEEYERQLQQACAAAEQMDKVIRDIKRP